MILEEKGGQQDPVSTQINIFIADDDGIAGESILIGHCHTLFNFSY